MTDTPAPGQVGHVWQSWYCVGDLPDGRPCRKPLLEVDACHSQEARVRRVCQRCHLAQLFVVRPLDAPVLR